MDCVLIAQPEEERKFIYQLVRPTAKLVKWEVSNLFFAGFERSHLKSFHWDEMEYKRSLPP